MSNSRDSEPEENRNTSKKRQVDGAVAEAEASSIFERETYHMHVGHMSHDSPVQLQGNKWK
jgi:hypothetical protein